ncbi:hypothetical protein [Aliicoccus persicus]|uniref:Uncharacterized protein n=1 Tax=Aliicoccus persicus TaxID=930138 RepID=A0A662Z369_9STAP|nr:hypothetical protein [Aliicoccus persicus]SEW01095.1 hypothetical protein SAMN05192557_1209 [Aliicoccus persicus]
MNYSKLGLSILFISVLIYCTHIISASIYSYTLLESSWNQNLGIFNTALEEISIIPNFIIIIFILIGISLLIINFINNKNR